MSDKEYTEKRRQIMSDNPSIDIIMPTYHTKELAIVCIKSFLKFSDGFDFNFYVIENSDKDYSDSILSLSDKVKWIQNPIRETGSDALGCALDLGISKAESDYVFMSHADVVACNKNWMKFLFDKIEKEKYDVAGFHGNWNQPTWHPKRIDAAHPAGTLLKTEIAKKVTMRPAYEGGSMVADSAGQLAHYCRDNDLKTFICKNTIMKQYNYEWYLNNRHEDPFKSFGRSVRSFDDDYNVLFLHLKRGVPKSVGTYNKKKSGMVLKDDWIELVHRDIL